MTQFTESSPPLPRGRHAARRRTPSIVAAALGGAVAAGLGLGAITILVLFLWITSPDPASGSGSALHVTAALWLLAHGATVLRTDALSGTTVPVGVTPMLLTAVPAWLLHRLAVHAVTGQADRSTDARVAPLGPQATLAWLLAGYLLVAGCVVLWTTGGPLRCEPVSALLHVPLLAAPAAAAGTWTACGRPSSVRLAAALPHAVRRAAARVRLPYGGLRVAARSGLAAAAVLTGGGAVLSTGSLIWHGHAAVQSLLRLSGTVSGRFAVLLLAVALVPNAAVWAAAYALGPGFPVGSGGWVWPAAVHGYPVALPDFPLLAELPSPTGPAGGSPLAWLVLLVPVAAGAVLARAVCREAVERGWPAKRTATVAALAAGCCGAAMAFATGLAAGPMGVGALARFGPAAWLTGAAALGWSAGVGVPGALLGRWWQVREPGIAPPDPAASPPDPAAAPLGTAGRQVSAGRRASAVRARAAGWCRPGGRAG